MSLRELRLAELLLERGFPVDEPGPGPYLPTALHILFQLPDERVQVLCFG